MKSTRTKTIALLVIILITVPAVLSFANAQQNHTVEENLVALAEKAGDRVQTLITSVYANANATEKIENANLTAQFEGNVTLYQTDGLSKLEAAKEALANSDYGAASDLALQALSVFREVYRSLQGIFEAADFPSDASVGNQELMDAITRELQRISTLKETLPANASEGILSLIDDANKTLLQAKALLQDGKTDEAKAQFLEAKQVITQIYQYLKTEATESNTWRINEYCQRLMQRIQERFRYGGDHGVNFTEALRAMGYQSETQFMQTLQERIQNAQGQGNLQSAVQECESLSQMVQNMEQALNQEINQQQQGPTATGGAGTGGDGAGSGNGSGGSGGSGSGKGGP